MKDWQEDERVRTFHGRVSDVAHWLRALDDALEQDQQKRKWRDHVAWCRQELAMALREMEEAQQEWVMGDKNTWD